MVAAAGLSEIGIGFLQARLQMKIIQAAKACQRYIPATVGVKSGER